MDSVILANEVVHSLKTSNTPGMLIKLDLSKAFDILSWQYMRSVLESFGFSNSWVDWILALTSSPFFSILVNGTPSRPFHSTRGIRQGDPFPPSSLLSWQKASAATSKPQSLMDLSPGYHSMTSIRRPRTASLLMTLSL
jgi:hypothetical protein